MGWIGICAHKCCITARRTGWSLSYWLRDDSQEVRRKNNTTGQIFKGRVVFFICFFWGVLFFLLSWRFSAGLAPALLPLKTLAELGFSCCVCVCVSVCVCQVCTTRQTAGWSYRTSSRTTTRCTACRVAPVISSLSRLSTRQEAATASRPASKPTVSERLIWHLVPAFPMNIYKPC